MTLDPATLAAILAMALVTYLTRVGGVLLVRFWRPQGRAAAALEAVPPAVLTAVIAPTVLATGPAESLAALVTILAALRLPLLAVVAVGVGAAGALRWLAG